MDHRVIMEKKMEALGLFKGIIEGPSLKPAFPKDTRFKILPRQIRTKCA